MIAIREPSLGPVMGIKGGAAGEAMLKYSQWRISTFISRVTCMPLQQQIMLFQH